MKSAKRLLSSLLVISLLTGCKIPIIRPPVVKDHEASFDGNTHNSGFIGFDAAGNGILTPHAKDRYDALVAQYGDQFHPPLAKGDGITLTSTNTYLIDAQHLVAYTRMNRWLKSGGPPK
jgi:hypothetical protein